MRAGGGFGESERGITLCKMRRGRCWNLRGAGLTMVGWKTRHNSALWLVGLHILIVAMSLTKIYSIVIARKGRPN